MTLADSVETFGVKKLGVKENESQEAGRERKNEKEEVQGESLDPQEEQGLSEDLHED